MHKNSIFSQPITYQRRKGLLEQSHHVIYHIPHLLSNFSYLTSLGIQVVISNYHQWGLVLIGTTLNIIIWYTGTMFTSSLILVLIITRAMQRNSTGKIHTKPEIFWLWRYCDACFKPVYRPACHLLKEVGLQVPVERPPGVINSHYACMCRTFWFTSVKHNSFRILWFSRALEFVFVRDINIKCSLTKFIVCINNQ